MNVCIACGAQLAQAQTLCTGCADAGQRCSACGAYVHGLQGCFGHRSGCPRRPDATSRVTSIGSDDLDALIEQTRTQHPSDANAVFAVERQVEWLLSVREWLFGT